MSRILLILAVIAAILLYPAVALAADGTESERLAGVVVTTIGIVLGVTRLLRASEDALHALLPERWRWVPAALLLALGGAATALPEVTDWWGYAVALLSAVGVVVVAATQGHQVRLTNPTKGTAAVVAPVNSKPSGRPPVPPAAAMVFLLVAIGLGGCAPRLATVAPPQSPAPELGAPPGDIGVRTPEEQADRCERTSDAAWWLRTISGGMVVAAGAEGAGAVPVDDRDVQRGLALGAGITAGTAAVLVYWGNALEQRYAEECTGEP